MDKRPTVKKDLHRLLSDCESQLKFLQEALKKLGSEPDRYKQIAGILRQLVCKMRRNEPLLLNLLEHFELEFNVSPPNDLPFPIMMIDDPPQILPDGWENFTMEEAFSFHRSKVKLVPLAKFIESGLAVFINPHKYSYRDLILSLADKMGGSHEDYEMEQPILELENFHIGVYSGHSAPLQHVTGLVLSAGKLLIKTAAQKGYKPHFYKI